MIAFSGMFLMRIIVPDLHAYVFCGVYTQMLQCNCKVIETWRKYFILGQFGNIKHCDTYKTQVLLTFSSW